jgi:hypothetical protein
MLHGKVKEWFMPLRIIPIKIEALQGPSEIIKVKSFFCIKIQFNR